MQKSKHKLYTFKQRVKNDITNMFYSTYLAIRVFLLVLALFLICMSHISKELLKRPMRPARLPLTQGPVEKSEEIVPEDERKAK